MPISTQTTQILIDLSKGEPSAASRLMPLVYDELRSLAARYMEQERPGHTLQATALVNDAYLKLIDQSRVDWKGRAHFFAVAAETIRRILVDHARGHLAAKRGGSARRMTLSDATGPPDAIQHGAPIVPTGAPGPHRSAAPSNCASLVFSRALVRL